MCMVLTPRTIRSDEVHRFEIKMKGFSHALEEGMDVVMWQLNRVADGSSPEGEDFAIRATTLRFGYIVAAICSFKQFLPSMCVEVT